MVLLVAFTPLAFLFLCHDVPIFFCPDLHIMFLPDDSSREHGAPASASFTLLLV